MDRVKRKDNWFPTKYSSVCSRHFTPDCFEYIKQCRRRLLRTAIPTLCLPILSSSESMTDTNTNEPGPSDDNNVHEPSDVETSNAEVCRICLATDVKMYSLQNTNLGNCMKSVAGIDMTYKTLPNYVCYECAPCLIKCNKLIEKSKAAETILQDILAKNGKITKSLIEAQKKIQTNLQSSLDSYLLINYFYIKYDDDNNTSNFVATQSDPNERIKIKNEIKDEDEKDEDSVTESVEFEISEIVGNDILNELKEDQNSDDDVMEIKVDIPEVEISDGETSEDFISIAPNNQKLEKRRGLVSQKFQPNRKQERKAFKRKWAEDRRRSRISPTALTPNNVDIEDNFDIVNIPFREQLAEWKKSTAQNTTAVDGVSCSVCNKTFAHVESLRVHASRHNSDIHGKVKCPVCLLYFSNVDAMRDHSERTQSKKYYCKYCLMEFKNIDGAKEHREAGCARSGHLSSRSTRPEPLLNKIELGFKWS